MEVEMSDKLQFVAGFHQSHTAENPDKLKFVGHFLSLPAVSQAVRSAIRRRGLKAELQTLFGGKNKMNKYRLLILIVLLIAATIAGAAQKSENTRRTLDIFYIDVEGGAATLIVTPTGESILIDAGWPGFEGRDAKRI